MKSINNMKLVFDSRSVNESFARTAVSGFIAQLDPTVEELADVKTALSEAVTNCVVHGYKDKIGKIYISADIFENGRVVIKIRDKGCGIENIKKAREPLFTTCETGERAGLGFAVMESMMDKIRVNSTYHKGTCVHMEKIINSKDSLNV
ncbi:MAG: anti-sigma F factor [Oscillospiraceae bacterium]